MAATNELIASACRHLLDELPALGKLKLLIRLELRGRGDVQVYSVGLPGPEINKGEPESPRLDISVSRSHFNELAEDGKLGDWHDAYGHGHVRVGGDAAVVKLLGSVIERHEARTKLKRVR